MHLSVVASVSVDTNFCTKESSTGHADRHSASMLLTLSHLPQNSAEKSLEALPPSSSLLQPGMLMLAEQLQCADLDQRGLSLALAGGVIS